MHISRRRLLSVLATTTATLTGCIGSDGGSNSTNSSQRDGEALQNVETDPSFEKLRSTTGETAVRSPTVEPDKEAGWAPIHWLINSAKDYFILNISSEAEGIRDVRELLEETDFSSESVLVHQYHIEECLTRHVRSIRWDETGVGVNYVAKDRKTNCEIDVFDVEASFVRIPGDIKEIGYFGSSITQ
ncbi:MAG: hypothetical protein SV253_01315 [Halobacteria archaeon]|nr:hypothetical protein [Halobacteria archaeon]